MHMPNCYRIKNNMHAILFTSFNSQLIRCITQFLWDLPYNSVWCFSQEGALGPTRDVTCADVGSCFRPAQVAEGGR